MWKIRKSDIFDKPGASRAGADHSGQRLAFQKDDSLAMKQLLFLFGVVTCLFWFGAGYGLRVQNSRGLSGALISPENWLLLVLGAIAILSTIGIAVAIVINSVRTRREIAAHKAQIDAFRKSARERFGDKSSL